MDALKISVDQHSSKLSLNPYPSVRRRPHQRLFNLFWSVEQHDANPTNNGTIGLLKSV